MEKKLPIAWIKDIHITKDSDGKSYLLRYCYRDSNGRKRGKKSKFVLRCSSRSVAIASLQGLLMDMV